MRFYFTPVSTNRKVGPMPVVTATRDTCPTSCSLMNNGCYAEHGHLGMLWARMNAGRIATLSFDELLMRIRELPAGQMWRYGQAGDLPDDPEMVLALARANRRRPVICYTHKRDLATYRRALQLGFTINLSADSLDEVDFLADSGLPVAVVMPSRFHRASTESISQFRERLGGKLKRYTKGGRPVAICPQTYSNTTCLQCGICARLRPGDTVVGFPAHGIAKRKVDKSITDPWEGNHEYRTGANIPSIGGFSGGTARPVHRRRLPPPDAHTGQIDRRGVLLTQSGA